MNYLEIDLTVMVANDRKRDADSALQNVSS